MNAQPAVVTLPERGTVSALFVRPERAHLLYLLAHGAGAGMHHPFLENVSAQLAQRGVATLRYQFPYMEAGRRRPDAPRALEETVCAAIGTASQIAPDLPLVAGGKSLGGRITSHIAASDPPAALRGVVFLGYPLHAPNRPDTKRAVHLKHIKVPTLFLQGTRDSLADLGLFRPIVRDLGDKATLHVVEGGDHSFKVLKRSGRTERQVTAEIADAIHDWWRGNVTQTSLAAPQSIRFEQPIVAEES